MNTENLNKEETAWLEQVRFRIAYNKDTMDYGLFLQHLVVLKRNFDDAGFVAAIALIGDQLTLYLNFTVLMKIPIAAAVEVVIHEVLHPICGHTGSRGKELREQYGEEIFGWAVDLVVNQYINTKLLKDAGLPPITFDTEVKLKNGTYRLRDLGFEPNQTSKAYAEKLAQLQWFEPPKDPRWEKFEESLNSAIADSVTQSVIERVGQLSQTTGKPGRGFGASDAQEFFAQRQGPAVIQWDAQLKRLYMHCISSQRIATPLRPSRRCDWHQGRISRQEVFVWFCIDTSGSMGAPELALPERELKHLRKLGARIRVLFCDAGIAKEFDYNGSPLGAFVGRGGTDFSPIFNKLHDTPRYSRPNMVVFLTDGYGSCDRYSQRMREAYMDDWDVFEQRNAPMTFERVPLLWLIPDTSKIRERNQFAKFGELAIVPTEELHESLR